MIKEIYIAICNRQRIDAEKRHAEKVERQNRWQSLTKQQKVKAIAREIVETVVFVVVMVIIIRFFVCEIRWIPSGSMRPTLIEGDRIIIERYSRFYKTPQRGDVMVFYPPFEQLKNTPGKVFSRLTGFICKDIAYIKRVIGLPGDNVEIEADSAGAYTVYVNGEPLTEPYIQSEYDYPECSEKVRCSFKIPEKQYLMLGDNRGNSQDGRYWGLLPEDRFIGKAVFLFWPLNRTKTLNRY
jgi:signal peptidase I